MSIEQQLSEIIDKNRLQLYKTAKAILCNEEDVYDAIQETLISVYKHINEVKDKKYLKTWTIRILINKCYDIIDKNKSIENKNKKIQDNLNNSFSDEFNNIENKIILNNALNKIDEDLKMVVVMYYYDELSVKEISKVLEIPEGTVKSKLSRSRQKLLEILKEKEEVVNE